ncbi:hypothetical protein ACFYNF_33295 [Streptomyces sp. NPDC006641]|uniref:hypothetical protein n=1 Tax=unclassified Streptomyces TaxID=2593676 RepID=UPI0036A7FD34
MPTVALLVSTPAPVCVERQEDRPESRRVPEPVVRAQHAAMVAAFPGLPDEGFDHVVVAENLYRLESLLQRLSDARRADLGWDGGDGVGDLLLVRRCFGPEILPMWRWRDGSQLAGRDRVADLRLGADRLVLALRIDIDGEGDIGFEVLMPCPVFDDCTSAAWAPVYSAMDLLRALTGDLATDPDTYCTDHGPDDPEGRADLEQQYADAVRA